LLFHTHGSVIANLMPNPFNAITVWGWCRRASLISGKD
jgi:hypothetical protein